jgi:hypothetical protein
MGTCVCVGTAGKAAVDEAPRQVGESLFKFVGQHETPVHRIEDTVAGGASALAVTVELPRIESMAQLTLDVTSRVVQVCAPSALPCMLCAGACFVPPAQKGRHGTR